MDKPIALVKTTIIWNDDTQSSRVLDIINRDSSAGMLRVFRAAMNKGAKEIKIVPYDQERDRA